MSVHGPAEGFMAEGFMAEGYLAVGTTQVPAAVPPPPPGPGVVPPFVTPPTDGTRQRRWWAVGLAGAAVLVLCIGGVIGLGSLVVLFNQAAVDQSKGAVTNFLVAVQAGGLGSSYDHQCIPGGRRTSP